MSQMRTCYKTSSCTIGSANIATIQVAGLLEEIEKAAVEKQSNLLNKVRLLDAK